MKLLITGAGGFLGAAITRASLAAGFETIAVVRRPRPERLLPLASQVRIVTMAMADEAAIAQTLRSERPDVVVHAAWSGLAGPERNSSNQIADNLIPTCRLIEAAAANGVRKVVGIGSQAEYGPLNRRISESDAPAPNSLYGAAKLSACYLGGEIARMAGTDFAWMRLFAAYGPGDNPNWLIPSLIEQLRRGERPRLTAGTQAWDYLYIDDAADAVLKVATSPSANGIFNLASGQSVPVRKVVEILRDQIAPGTELVFGEVPFSPGQIMHMEGNIDRLCHAAGWAPRTDLREGLSRTIEAMP
jgi:nucleoside-diphosphate-sugar epimerase